MRVLVTGATGYLGGRVVLALMHASHEVRALVRKTSEINDLPPQVELAYGDLRDLQSLIAAFNGCEAVVHMGAMVSPWSATPALYYSINVEGLKNVLEAMKLSPSVKKLIYTSSYFALGPTGEQPADEGKVHSGKDFTSEYEKSKYLADIVVRDAAKEGTPVVMLYPGVIYGPGKRTSGNVIAQTLIERFNHRIPGYLGPGRDRNPLCFIDDVAHGHLAALDQGRCGQRYLLCGDSVSFAEIFNFSAELTKTSKPRFTIPLWMMEIYGQASVFVARITGITPIVTPEVVAVMRNQWIYISAKAEKELGYKSRPWKEGLCEVLTWLKDSGFIKY